MKRIYRTPGRSGGFSLIEVMIAVVVLATGLLALAALQGSLTRSSAEAKTRSRVAALLSGRMDELRGSGYENEILNPGATTLNAVDACDRDPADPTDWFDCARVEANLGSLTLVQTNELWTSAVGAANFGTVANRGGVVDGNPEFIRVTLRASWTDASASANPHSLAMTSEFSSLALRDSLLPPPAASGTLTGAPIVRQDNPAVDGVIPIAVGGGDATAASNPRPELVGKNNNTTVTGTRFDVLTYSGLTGVATIQRRVETAAIKCQCRLGAGGNNLPVIYRKSEWPAVWTGERYDVYEGATDAPGQGRNSGPAPGVDQSPLCQECCRDHFDSDAIGVAKFDPERTGAHQHYLVYQGALTVPSATDSDYVEACRVIRVDGFWRTAADMYARQFGLLATETVDGKEAATGLPSTAATNNYQTFVKDYLRQIDGTGAPPTIDAPTMFDQTARALNEPDDVDIETPLSTDYRYLHGRGLYLDYLEEDARERITAVLADRSDTGMCPSTRDIAECILPFLPFTTANVTELTRWTATDTNILSINSGGQLGTNPTQPSGGRTAGLQGGVADNGARINLSNFGLAASSDPLFVSLDGVDAADAAAIGTDKQTFDVGGNNSPPNSGEEFSVRISGATTQDLDAFYAVGGGSDVGECLQPNSTANYRCATNTTPISGGRVTVSNYWIETTVSKQVFFTCGTKSGTFTVNVPTFQNYQVISASIAGTQGAPVLPISNEGTVTEATTYTFGSELADGSAVDIVVAVEGSPQDAGYSDCKISGNNPEQISGIVWTYPWRP